MLAVTIVNAADNAPPAKYGDVSDLWRVEAKPLPRAAPSDASVQEIVIGFRTANEQRFVFDAFEPELTERIAGICNSLYVTRGNGGVVGFLNAITETGWNSSDEFPFPVDPDSLPPVRGEPVYVSAIRSPRREALRIATEASRDRLTKFSKTVVERLQPVALDVAVTRLGATLQDLATQSARYLGGPHGAANFPIVDKSTAFAGDDGASFIEALVEIATMRHELEFFQAQSDAAQRAVRRVGLRIDGATALGPSLLGAALRQDLRGLLDAPGNAGALARSTQGLEAARRVLAQSCAELCRVHPVLYRLWQDDLLLDIADLWNRTPAASRRAAVVDDFRLVRAVAGVLNDTTHAARNFISDLRGSPEDVWKYPRVVEDALRALYLDEGDIAWRAAMDYAEQQHGAMSPLSKASLGLGIVDMIAFSAAAAPPVAIAISVLSAGAAIADLVSSAIDQDRKDHAFAACLDPADSLALEAGSYAGIVVGALFILLQLRGIQASALKLAVPP